MADPISALGLAQQCFDLAKAIYDYVQAVRDAPAERLVLSSEMQNVAELIQLLINLGVPGTRAQDDAALLPGEIAGPMQRMKTRMAGIRNTLDLDGEVQAAVGLPSSSSREWRDRMRRKAHEVRQNLTWPFDKDEIVGHLNALERDKTFMMLYLQGNDYMLSQTTQRDVSALKDSSAEMLRSVQITERRVNVLADHHLDERTMAILRWLSGLDFAPRQRQLCAQRRHQEATGVWFLDTPQVRAWLEGAERLLCASGVAGSGKTMLASITVEHISTRLPNVPLAFVFFEHKSQREYGRTAVLAAILRGFLQSEGKVPSDLAKLYDARYHSGDPPEPEEVMEALATFVRRREKVFIVLDALDESSSGSSARHEVLSDILRLCEYGAVYVLVTIRAGHSSHEKFESLAAVAVRADAGDVRRYLLPRMTYMPALIRQDETLKRQVVDGICAKVQDVFIIAQYHLQAVEAARSPRELRHALGELPSGSQGLDMLYGRCLERIDQQAPAHRRRLHWMLDLLICCKRALRPSEIIEALALNIQDTSLDVDDCVSIEDLVGDTEGLVVLDHGSDVVSFAHETVHHYILSMRIDHDRSYAVAELCLQYLSLNNLLKFHPKLDVYSEIVTKQHPFFDYAATYWGEHVKDAMPSTPHIEDQVLELLRRPYRACDGYTGRLIMENAIQRGMTIWKGYSFDRGGHWKTRARAKLRLPPIQHAVYFGLSTIVQRLLHEGADPNSLDPHGNFLALNAAVQTDRLDVATLLLDRGADPNAIGNNRSPLNWAVECAALEMISLLVDRGANLDTQNTRVDPPLCTACERDRADVADYLVQHGADLDNCTARKPYTYRTPLSYVLDKGRPKCRELLLFKHKILTPERGQKLLLPCEDAELVRRLIQEAGVPAQQQTFGLGHSALDVALRLESTPLLNLCLEHRIPPRLYWDLTTTTDCALTDLTSQHPALHTLLAAQLPPALAVHRVAPADGWKADYKAAFRAFLTFALPPTTFSAPPAKVVFDITSRDQGWSSFPHDHGTYHGGASEFRAEVALPAVEGDCEGGSGVEDEDEGGSESGNAKESDGDSVESKKVQLATEVRPKIVQNVHAGEGWKRHVIVWERGEAREEVRSWLEACKPGMEVRVFAQAADEGWENWVKEMRVMVWA